MSLAHLCGSRTAAAGRPGWPHSGQGCKFAAAAILGARCLPKQPLLPAQQGAESGEPANHPCPCHTQVSTLGSIRKEENKLQSSSIRTGLLSAFRPPVTEQAEAPATKTSSCSAVKKRQTAPQSPPIFLHAADQHIIIIIICTRSSWPAGRTQHSTAQHSTALRTRQAPTCARIPSISAPSLSGSFLLALLLMLLCMSPLHTDSAREPRPPKSTAAAAGRAPVSPLSLVAFLLFPLALAGPGLRGLADTNWLAPVSISIEEVGVTGSGRGPRAAPASGPKSSTNCRALQIARCARCCWGSDMLRNRFAHVM
eukprot:1157783-Pelagomonas_calceolata.AAC.3